MLMLTVTGQMDTSDGRMHSQDGDPSEFVLGAFSKVHTLVEKVCIVALIRFMYG